MNIASKGQGQRIIQYRFGTPQDVLRVESGVVDRPLNDDEVLIEVARSVIHPGDLQLIASKYTQPPPPIPQGRVPGLEAAGIVVDAAPGALDGTGLSISARVAFFAPGAWQTYAIVPAGSLIAIPDDLSDDIATQVLINTITARHVLRTALQGLSVRPRRIVQTGASSAVGKLITTFALKDGFNPIRLVRSPETAAKLARTLPSGDIIVTAGEGWQDAVRAAAEGDIALVVDGVGGAMVGELAALLNTKGRLVSYGLLGDAPADLTLFAVKSLSLIGATIGAWSADTDGEAQAQDMRAAIEIGRSAPELFAESRGFELSDLDTAIAAVTAPGKTGDIILKF